jgi:GTP cyclohydrolase I
MVDKNRIENAVREILLAIGDNPDRDGLKETPERVARMYEEIFSGLHRDPLQEIKVFEEDLQDEMVIVKASVSIPCVSTIFFRFMVTPI